MSDASPSPSPASPDGPAAAVPDSFGVLWIRLPWSRGGAGLVTEELLEELDGQLQHAESLARDGEARALIVQGGAPGSFLAGADLGELAAVAESRDGRRWAAAGQRVLRRLEQLPIPSIAAIDGLCLGAGLELALACGYRLAADSPRTRLGLPEVRLGLIPGLGGTVRLPRLIGLQAALDLILTGRAVDAQRAGRLGLVDRVVAPHRFESEVESFARERIERGRIRTGARRRMPRRLLEDTAPGRRMILARAARRLPDRDPAAAYRRALDAIAEGIALPLDRAFRREAKLFGQMAATERAGALIHAARLRQEAGRGALASPAPPLSRVAVLGAGEVGSQFAYLLARARVPLRLKDRKRTAVAAGIQAARARLARDVEAGRLSADQAKEHGDLVEGATGFGGFGTLDLLVAAVGDHPDAVQLALREAEEHTREGCVLASSSSLVPITDLQRSLSSPARVVGLHLSLPADAFPLMEVVAGEQTAEWAVEVARQAALRLGRTPIRVADRPGLLADRLLALYFAEATRMLAEGATVARVDGEAERFGLAVGPFRRMDMMGPERAARLLRALAERLGERMRPSPVLDRVLESGEGFFRYRRGHPVEPNPVLPGDPAGPESEPIAERLVLLLINEAVMALEEEVASPDAVELAALLGLGFPRPRGGLLYYADRLGAGTVAAGLRRMAALQGERFAPASLLQRLADEGGRLLDTRRRAC